MKKKSLRKSKRCGIYAKEDLVLMMTIRNTTKFAIIVIILENIEEHIKHQKKLLQYFIMVLHMIIIL